MSTDTITVAIADDQPLVRGGLQMIIEDETDLRIVGEAADGATAVELVFAVRPDVLLLDVQMPTMDGIEAMQQIAASGLPTRVLMLTTFDLDEYVFRAMRAGASGFLLKDMSVEDIVIAIRQVAHGADSLLAPAVTRRLLERFTTTHTSAPDQPLGLNQLTTRETDVLREIGRGLSNAEIAGRLFITEATVKTHVARILMKLGLRGRVQAAILAHEAGLSGPGIRGDRDGGSASS